MAPILRLRVFAPIFVPSASRFAARSLRVGLMPQAMVTRERHSASLAEPNCFAASAKSGMLSVFERSHSGHTGKARAVLRADRASAPSECVRLWLLACHRENLGNHRSTSCWGRACAASDNRRSSMCLSREPSFRHLLELLS